MNAQDTTFNFDMTKLFSNFSSETLSPRKYNTTVSANFTVNPSPGNTVPNPGRPPDPGNTGPYTGTERYSVDLCTEYHAILIE